MRPVEPAEAARLEGLEVELREAARDFASAAVDCLEDRAHTIVRKFPQFYSNEQRAKAGVPVDWSDRLYPAETRSWRRYNKGVCAVLRVWPWRGR